MPVIKKEKIQFDEGEFTRQIKVSSVGEFSCELPPFLEYLSERSVLFGNNIGEIKKQWNTIVNKHRDSQTTTSRVICYGYEANCLIHRNVEEHGEDCHIKKDISFIRGTGLIVWASVFDEECRTLADGMKKYKYSRPSDKIEWPYCFETSTCEVNNKSQKYDRLIPYTPTNAEFFITIHAALEQLIISIDKITGTPEALLAMIDSGLKLLPAPVKKEAV